MFLKKINIIYPIEFLNTNYIYYRTKFILLKFIYKDTNFNTYIDSIKFISNYYTILLKKKKSFKMACVKQRQALKISTKKIRQQKGLGKARLGSAKSPLLRGGARIFGPKNGKLIIFLNKKCNKLNSLFLFLNKRTQISFMFFLSIFHNFKSIVSFLKQQERIKGYNNIWNNKILYIFNCHNLKNKKKDYSFNNSIFGINFHKFLIYDYIIFFI